MREHVDLINYKGYVIVVTRSKNGFVVGVKSETGIVIWFEDHVYNSVELARTSGREYARIVVDKMVLARRKDRK